MGGLVGKRLRSVKHGKKRKLWLPAPDGISHETLSGPEARARPGVDVRRGRIT